MAITWNPLDKSNLLVLTNENLTVTHEGSGYYAAIRATEAKSSGKWYWEVKIGEHSVTRIGLGKSGDSLDKYLGMSGEASYGYSNNGRICYNGGYILYSSFTTNDIIGVAIDLDIGRVWWAKNNTWLGSGDPASNTNPHYTGLTGAFYPMYSDWDPNDSATARFLETDQTYSAPEGFSPLDIPPPSYCFSGYISEQQVPASRKMYLYERLTGDLVTTTTSSGDGYYYMETASSGSHNIVCLDDEAGTKYNDLIRGNVFPATISG